MKVVRLKDGYKTRGVWGHAPPGKFLHLYVLNMLFRAFSEQNLLDSYNVAIARGDKIIFINGSFTIVLHKVNWT